MLSKIFVKLRNYSFWIMDALQSGKVRKAYTRIKKIDSLDSTSKEIQTHQISALRDLIKHAKGTTGFYSQLNANEIKDFPVINKSVIKENQESFLSTSFEKKDLYTMSTSGSTGTPFTCYQDKNKKRCVNAEIIYYSEKVGYSVGKHFIFLRALKNKRNKSTLIKFAQNEDLIDISNLDNHSIKRIIKMFKREKQPSYLLAYASTYDTIKNYIERENVDFNGKSKIKGVISGAEWLHDETREVISTCFNAPVVSRYSNQENGVLGQDEDVNNVFIINEAHYYIEVLDLEKDSLVEDGEVGRIVVTDLYNYAMPMIRYDTGDVGAISLVETRGKLKRAISGFSGRKLDIIFDVNGNRLSPYVANAAIWKFPQVKQFQFVQKSSYEYVIKLEMAEEDKEVLNQIRQTFYEILGGKANITLEVVNEIPVLSSGKRRYIINESTN